MLGMSCPNPTFYVLPEHQLWTFLKPRDARVFKTAFLLFPSNYAFGAGNIGPFVICCVSKFVTHVLSHIGKRQQQEEEG